MKDKEIILWISHYPATRKQRKELKRIFGKYDIIWHKYSVKNVDEVINLMYQYKATQLITSLPKGMIKALVDKGIKPIRPVMKKMEVNFAKKPFYYFLYFIKYKKIEIETEIL